MTTNETSLRRSPWLWWNALSLVLVLITNGLAQWLPLGGKTTGELSAKYSVLITPSLTLSGYG